jgi:hypothetical protein
MTALLMAYNQLNILTPKEIEDLNGFFGFGPNSKSLLKNTVTA